MTSHPIPSHTILSHPIPSHDCSPPPHYITIPRSCPIPSHPHLTQYHPISPHIIPSHPISSHPISSHLIPSCLQAGDVARSTGKAGLAVVDKGKEINERYHVTDKVGRGILIGQSGARCYSSYYRYCYYTCYYCCYGWSSSSGLLVLRVLLVSGARRGLSYGSKRVWRARPLRWLSLRPSGGVGGARRRPFWRSPLTLNGNLWIV